MALELNGTTGVSLVQDGVVTAADLAAGAARSNFGAGAVLQLVQAQTTTLATSASATLISSNITASITPTSSSSKILVLVNCVVDTGTNNSIFSSFELRRDSTAIFNSDRVARYSINSAYNGTTCWGVKHLDSPATDSAVTYTLYFARTSYVGSYYGTTYIGNNYHPGTITLMEIAA